MRMRPSPRALALLAAAAALAVGAAGGRAQEQPAQSVDEAGWQGVLGVRAPVSTAQRYVVLLRPPSLAARVRAAGRACLGDGDARLVGVRRRAAGAVPRAARGGRGAHRSRVPLHARRQRLLGSARPHLGGAARRRPRGHRHLPGAHRVSGTGRRSRTAASFRPPWPTSRSPGLDGSGVTVALLDTGVDPSHPYLRRRVLSGVDVINPGSGGIAQPHPTIPGRPERHGTELAGIIAGTEGPDGLHGIAPGASILPVPRRRLAAERRGRLQRLLAHRPAPRRARGGRRSERRRRRARRRPHRADRDGRAVRRVRRRPAPARDRRRGRPRPADDRPGRERRARGPGIRQRRRAGRRGRRRSPSAPPTVGSPPRPSACTCAPACACCTRRTSRSAARRPRP